MSAFTPASYVDSHALPEFDAVLWQWIDVIDKFIEAWSPGGVLINVPWWYNEQASVSTLAGAVWNTGGLALQDTFAQKYWQEVDMPRELYAGTC